MKAVLATLVTASLFTACTDPNDDEKFVDQQGKVKTTKVDTPIISAGGATQTSVNITVCGGAVTGAPAGFSLQWMPAASYDPALGWPSDSDTAAANGQLCKASFSGNANLSRYNLAPGECVTVNVGEFLFDNGASVSGAGFGGEGCDAALSCGTEYVFRAFAHATSTLYRSDFTSNLSASTLACGNSGGCTLTQGYWKTHNPLEPVDSPLHVEWPLAEISLGGVSYDIPQCLSIFNEPARGNGLIALAHQLMAAKLNTANSADASEITATIDFADALIGLLVVPPVGTGYLPPSITSALTSTLASYNEGAIGPGHCE